MTRIRNSIGASLLMLALMVGGCARTSTARRPSMLPATAQESGTDHVLAAYGLPELASGFTHPPATQVERDGWIALHNNVDLIPLWVCHRLDASDTEGDADRDRCSWKSDPQLGDGATADDDDYTGSGYSRGHMAPADDFSFSQDETCETFFFTNAVPQIQLRFNGGIWSGLESRCHDAAVARGSVFIITGPMFYDPVDDEEADEHDPALDDDIVVYTVIGENMVAVPTHLFKIIVDATDEDDPSAIAFVMENRSHPKKADDPQFQQKHTRSIRWIEERTGLDFLPLLDEFGIDSDDFETADASFDDWPEFKP